VNGNSTLLIRNAQVLDVEHGTYLPDQAILIRDGRVAEIGSSDVGSGAEFVLDVAGRTVMPGLIDAHVHVTAVSANLASIPDMSPSYVAAGASRIAAGMLRRGFTTVRDAGGADYGFAVAVAEGLFQGPRIMFGGKALSQTGGHGDDRGPGREVADGHPCVPGLSHVCDGAAEVRRAARSELRRGADHLKVMLGGGVASPTDRVDSLQFSVEEIRVIVEEASAANRYVMGHAYTAAAVNRGLECGVRSIEHGNLMDESSPPLFKAHGAFYVPTLATYDALEKFGAAFGFPAESRRKVHDVLDGGLRALELAHRNELQIAFGTDLLGEMHREQLNEFAIRAEVQPLLDVIRSATIVAARLLRLEGSAGTLAPGAFGDLIVLDGDPLIDVTVLTQPEDHLRVVVKGGGVVYSSLSN
jgi:imidazolonepropionase-like amidohydrolase